MPDVTDRPRAKSLRPLRALWPFLAPHWALLTGALTALLVAAAAMLALPAALRQLIDHGLSSANSRVLNAYLAGFLVAAAAFGVFAALRFYLVTWLGERVVADLRQAVYRRVVRMDPTFFEVTRTGEVLSRLTADTTLVQAIAGVNLSITLRSALNLIGAAGAAGAHQRPAHDLDPGTDAGGDRADDRGRAPGTTPVARHPGPDRRHQQRGR